VSAGRRFRRRASDGRYPHAGAGHQRRRRTRRGARSSRSGSMKETDMPSMRDKKDRPVVVVTGFGIVTSLGVGKAENWAKLSAGESGIHPITRFATENLKTRSAGTVDFVPVESVSAPSLSERFAELAAEEAVGQSGIGRRADFPGPLFLAVPPVEVEWPQRRALAAAAGGNDAVTYRELLRVSSREEVRAFYHRFRYDSVADYLAEKFGTKGSPLSVSTACASGRPAIPLGVAAIRRRRTQR